MILECGKYKFYSFCSSSGNCNGTTVRKSIHEKHPSVGLLGKPKFYVTCLGLSVPIPAIEILEFIKMMISFMDFAFSQKSRFLSKSANRKSTNIP